MKKNVKYLSLFVFGLLVMACEDPDLKLETFDEADKGAIARNLALSGSYSLSDLVGSSIAGRVEFYDENDGKNVKSYDWTVEFRPAIGSNSSAIPFLMIPSSQFSENVNGLPEVSFSLQMEEALAALGMSIDQVASGDIFRFEATITKLDGTTYSSANAGNNLISQSPFASLFRVSVTVQ